MTLLYAARFLYSKTYLKNQSIGANYGQYCRLHSIRKAGRKNGSLATNPYKNSKSRRLSGQMELKHYTRRNERETWLEAS